MRPHSIASTLRGLVCVLVCMASIAGSSISVSGELTSGPPAPPAPPAAAPNEPSKESGTPASFRQARARKEPRKETAAGRKRRFFKTPAGALTLAILGAVVAGGLVQSSLGDRNTASH